MASCPSDLCCICALQVADAVHAKGSYIYMQLWALGRAARVRYLREQDPDYAYVAPSDVPLASRDDVPRPLTVDGAHQPTATLELH